MRIKNIDITAFGGIKDLHIKADSGLNVIYGENGSGKSTVMSFIKSVFYGIGRGKERTSRIPWDGAKASGSILYEHKNLENLCQVSFGKTARGDSCEVLNNVTGEKVSSEYPGNLVFSMSDVTFSKTAFISSSGAAVEQKGADEIAEKLSNLKETGDDGISFSTAVSDADSYLAKLIAKRGRGGRIQQLEDSIEELKIRLKNAEAKADETDRLREKTDALKKRQSEIKREIEVLKKSADVADFQYCKKIKSQLDEIKLDFDIPSAEELLKNIEDALSKLRSAENMIAELSSDDTSESGISQDDFNEATERFYSRNKKRGWPGFIVMVALALCFLGFGFVNPWFFIGVVLFGALAFVYRPALSSDKRLEEILSAYNMPDYEALRIGFLEQERKNALRVKNLEKAEEYCREKAVIESRLEELYKVADSICGDRKNLKPCIENAKEMSLKKGRLESAFTAALRGRDFFELESLYGNEAEIACENAQNSLATLEYELEAVAQELSGLERQSGFLEGSGCDRAELIRQIAELSEKKEELAFNYNVMSTVLQVFNEAYEVMEGEFGSKLNDAAGEILNGISGYKDARMSRDFNIKLSENGEVHSLDEFSTGLYEQAYLSFRLAMLSLTDSESPVFLDDCLMTYDDSRAEKTLLYLKELSEDRQIFLFTCRSRDYNIAKKLGANCLNLGE